MCSEGEIHNVKYHKDDNSTANVTDSEKFNNFLFQTN